MMRLCRSVVRLLTANAVLFGCLSLRATTTWYVDGSVETDQYDGLGEVYDPATGHGPKKYIQSAVSLATIAYNNSGDHDQHVVVLPGSYGSGEHYPSGYNSDNACACRVVISRPLTLTARDGKEKTEIVGRFGTVADEDQDASIRPYFENLGKDAVRCIYVAEAAAGTVIEGFTLRNGATWYNYDKTQTTDANKAEKGVNVQKHYGGGICALSSDIYVCDCDIRDCWGFYAGTMYRGTAARCKFEGGSVGWQNSAVILNSLLSNCLLLRNGQTTTRKSYLVRGSSYVVNCTMVGNDMTFMHKNASTNYNGLCWGNYKEGATDATTDHFAFRSVYSKSSAVKLAGGGETCSFDNVADCFYSSGTDDYRLMEDSPAIGFGRFDDLERLTANIPARYRLRDYLGNEIVPDADGKICCGAIQAVVRYDELKSGTLEIQPAKFDAFDGRPLVYSSAPYDLLQIRGESQELVAIHAVRCGLMPCYFHASGSSVAFPDANTNFVFALPPLGTSCRLAVATESASYGKMTVTGNGSGFVVAVSDQTRPFRGFRINGELDVLPWSMSLSSADLGGKCVEPFYTADWHVSPSGNDKNNGMTPFSAFQTLQAAMENPALAQGDTVHAAAGVYDQGERLVKFNDGQKTKDSDDILNLPSRVVVPAGIKLLADEGPEKTFIVGAAATDSSAALGLGAGAVRCVLLQSGVGAQISSVEGFTLTGGRTLNQQNTKGSYNDSDNVGGGVASDKISASNAGIVRNCIISNCCARIGGGSYGARLVNTRVYDVNAADDGAVAFFGFFSGCVFDHVRTDAVLLRNYRSLVVGCTFGADIFNAAGTAQKTSIGVANDTGTLFHNNIVRIRNTFDANVSLANCVLLSGSSTDAAASAYECALCDESVFASLLDAENRPIVGLSNELISKGGNVVLHDWSNCGDLDAWGNPRISNGALSIGACQADWRGQYANVLCGGRVKVEVTSASTNELWAYGDKFLRLSAGDSLCFKAKRRSTGVGSLSQDVTGGGVLSVFDGDARVYPTGDVYRIFAHDNDEVSISCTGTPESYVDIYSLTFAKHGLVLMVR